MTHKIFGHKSPDTDSTGSPIIWAWYLNECRNTAAEARLLGEPNAEALFVLDRWNLDKPNVLEEVGPGDSCIIVDTNNVAELPDGINDAEVIEVIDHHMLQGGLKTKTPITITVRPLACTATIMHDLMGDDALRMPHAIKGVMLSCILSDTLEFRSPTTTDADRELAERLAGELDIDIAEYAQEMFAAKSDVSGYTDAELLRVDAKAYEVDGTSLRISVLETTSPSSVLDRKAGLMKEMEAVAVEDGVDQVLFFLVDILSEEATLFITNDSVRRIAVKSFGVEADGDLATLPGVVSRKKQIIPVLKV
ncbi:MAG: manganese-dependent inorganic pyrophosphatase [Boseongicola sp. SB0662_bin_57]|nr:manganese-dependent inorganic pyrophosphatase [Boseongicola sp. SB0662_bin_57]